MWHLDKHYYYAPRPAGKVSGAYWAPKLDPDGVLRDRNTEIERLQYLDDVRDELAFAESAIGSRVLDFGAGLGWFLGAMGEKWIKHAVEEDEGAKQKWPAEVEDIRDLICVPDGYYDVIVCHHVIEHCPCPIKVLIGLRGKLRRYGYLIFSTPDFDSPCAQRFGTNYRMLHDPTHVSLFTRVSAERFLVDYGFSVLDVRYPFPDRYATPENFARWNDVSKVSPPWPGNWMTFYAQLR